MVHMTYQQLYHRVECLKRALLLLYDNKVGAGKNNNDNNKPTPTRVLLLYIFPNRADMIAWILALQAAHCTLLFATPDAFAGLRPWAKAMLALKPDVVIGSRTLLTVFRSLALSLGVTGRDLTWIRAAVILKRAAKEEKQENATTLSWNKDNKSNIPFSSSSSSSSSSYCSDNDDTTDQVQSTSSSSLDSVTTVMFSGGTTGMPTPIEITQRMLCFQAHGYAKLLEKHFGKDILRKQSGKEVATKGNNVQQQQQQQQSYGPWTSTHVFINFVLLDIMCGGTAVLQPMGLSSPDQTVCTNTLVSLFEHFQTQVTSAPPALWRRMIQEANNSNAYTTTTDSKTKSPKPLLPHLKMAFVGGAETSVSFARAVATHVMENAVDNDNDKDDHSCVFYRVYGATQVLPVTMASAADILREEEEQCRPCASGCGVYFGAAVEGLTVAIDKEAWQAQGGNTQLEVPVQVLSNGKGKDSNNSTTTTTTVTTVTVDVGELCVYGKALSPTMEIVSTDENDASTCSLPTRIFRTGDTCYVHPMTGSIYFMGRMAQAVDCGKMLKRVPPVAVEMMCLETEVIDRCAFVGVKYGNGSTDGDLPVVVFQNDHDDDEMDIETDVKPQLRRAIQHSVWSELLNNGISIACYRKPWPVDVRHSSKINRNLLRDWASQRRSKLMQL